MRCEACGHENVDGARFCASCGVLMPVAEEAGDDAMIGKVIGGRFRVTGVLGEGGMGVVYVGEQQMGSTVRKVAIKTLHAHLSKDPSVLARFHRECGTVAQLEHPNTIKVYDFGSTDDGTLYIAMEFVQGKPLSDVMLEGGAMAPDRVLNIARQICGALEEAHGQGIVHRDLKPENIILTTRAGERDFVKVLDFGIAARTESADAAKEQKLTQQGMVLGTPPYMSPEQFTGKQLDHRSDVYSLGVMVYEMLTGKLPFEADTPWQWATQHMTAQPTPFEATPSGTQVPSNMRAAILRSLSKDRDQRQSDVKEFLTELSQGPVEPAAATAPGYEPTAAMPAAPDMLQQASAAAATPGPAGMPPAVAPAVAPHLPAAPPRSSGGSGKGLLIGLGALGAVLLIAIVVVAARSIKPDDEQEALTNPFTADAASGPVTVAPVVDPPAAPTEESPTTEPTAEAPPEKVAGGSKAPAKSPPKTEPKQDPPKQDPPKQDPPKTSGGDSGACESCISAARSGQIQAAASAFNRCSDASLKSKCSSMAGSQAAVAARRAAFSGNCSQANAIVAAATAMGAGQQAQKAVASTSCK